ncbi:DUF6543 domain-containing protein [Pseudomonas sp. PSKL.D1]|uniref:DUF6543 domain-containing protein n=1 Tax=Pseudomonas sp. PSKL.D1 TaxID=3029060 RepID=UPI0023816745|nr:DUF6543 domain-containing protein [Pseudomonas sp. PSKL.D1]WDY59731.1 hypothetical protein PVV54_08935 [Pseudomonas sp. PSKL.D1]
MLTPTRLPRSTTLPCAVAQRFAARPTLFEVAARILAEQWQLRELAPELDPLELELVSFGLVPGIAYVRPLHQVLVERYCMRGTLNLTPGQDTISRASSTNDDEPVPVALHAFELLLNECGPLLLEHYQSLITQFWCTSDLNGETPWQWYTRHLQALMKGAIEQIPEDGPLAAARNVLGHLAGGPVEQSDLERLQAVEGITIQLVYADISVGWQLDPSLSCALLIERPASAHHTALTLLFTSTGQLMSFASREQLLQAIARHWPPAIDQAPPAVRVSAPQHSLFQAQALGLLGQQLKATEVAARAYHGQDRAIQLANALDKLTEMANFCSEGDLASHAQLQAQLPGWMKDANPRALLVFSSMLTDIAQATADANGGNWLDGVPDAQTFAYDRLAELIHRDHPESTLDLHAIRVLNQQTTSVAIPVGGQLVEAGDVKPVTFTLAELAIANLNLLKPGSVTLQAIDGQAIPTWFDTATLRALITEADVGAAYPRRLRQELLDDHDKRTQRQQLFANQLSTQLPAQAMTAYLRDGQLSLAAVVALEQVFAPLPGRQSTWQLQALGLLRTLDAPPDYPQNTWLIEDASLPSSPCLLYRPMHSAPLLLFADRPALLEAISQPGALQEDLLHRLPVEDRRVYAHGGFREPHLFHPYEDDWAVPFGTPAPVTLSRETAMADPAGAIYQACVDETLSNFAEQSASSAQTRFQRWQHLGWLLLNTLLPFTEGPLTQAVWLIQMETALARLLDDQQPQQASDRTGSWIELLVNVAFLIFTHVMRRLDAEHPLDASLPPGLGDVLAPTPVILAQQAPSVLDFTWSSPSLKLSQNQADALAVLQADVNLAELGPPVPSGPMRGLFWHQNSFWVAIAGKAYHVSMDTEQDQPRITGGADGATPGPFIERDEVGRWRFDLGLRLRGGLPTSSRLAQLKAARQARVATLLTRVAEDSQSIVTRLEYLDKVRATIRHAEDPRLLRVALEKLQAFETFLNEHLLRMHELNELTPVTSYKTKRAGTLTHLLDCQLGIRVILMRLHKPERARLAEMIENKDEIGEDDVPILTTRLDTLSTLSDQLFDNAVALEQRLEQLRQLASPSLPNATGMYKSVQQKMGNWPPLYWRHMRIEACTNRIAIADLDETGSYWLDRFWGSIELAVSQRLQLAKQQNTGDEIRRRLLDSIAGHLATAKRRLAILKQHFDAAAVPPALLQLQVDLNEYGSEVASELAEYPEFPPSNSITQLSRQLPGLIETAEDGLMLGQPRAEDEDIVDIPGVSEGSITRSYKREQGQWVATAAPARPPRPAPAKLKALLRQTDKYLASARKDLALMQTANASTYLPVEIEEILLHHRDTLDGQRLAIEQNLTRDNETDEASAGGDAALSIKALEDLCATLAVQATQLRIRAALKQKPRMGELRLLLQHDQVQIHAPGTRQRLAKLPGRADDYLDEYTIRHAGEDIWYAHFHYSGPDSAKAAFTAGHLKTAEQRMARGRTTDDGKGHTVDVYRSPIDLAAAERYFFSL